MIIFWPTKYLRYKDPRLKEKIKEKILLYLTAGIKLGFISIRSTLSKSRLDMNECCCRSWRPLNLYLESTSNN